MMKKKVKVRSRGKCVFPAKNRKVKDNRDHFPINNIAQAHNALARANQYDKSPKWYAGPLKDLVRTVANTVKRNYKSIKVTDASYRPGKN